MSGMTCFGLGGAGGAAAERYSVAAGAQKLGGAAHLGVDDVRKHAVAHDVRHESVRHFGAGSVGCECVRVPGAAREQLGELCPGDSLVGRG